MRRYGDELRLEESDNGEALPLLEKILETYYAVRLLEGFVATADYQLIVNPGYNRDRGPVSVFSMRLRAER